MAEYYEQGETQTFVTVKKKENKRYLLHFGLFLLTFITTTIAGADWISGHGGPYELNHLLIGLPYSISIMFIITCHEFGHYFAAKYHKVKSTFPFYIPFPSLPGFLNFGTMGAVIKTKSPINSNKAMFDIGVSGPIAGFIATLIILMYGFLNVPGENYLLTIHPDYYSPEYGKDGLQLEFGGTVLFSIMKYLLVDSSKFFPPMTEIYHYPFLCVGWFGMFVTAMNMIPVGQLDGGHIGYTMFGAKKHNAIASVSFIILIVLGLLGIFESVLEIHLGIGWTGWLFWAMILYFVIKIQHPPIPDDTELDSKRVSIGYLSYLILFISFSPTPFILSLSI